MLGARPRLSDDRLVARRARRDRAHDRVAHVADARLHPLRHRRLVAVPVPVERVVVHAGRLVEDREHHDARRRRRRPVAADVRVVAVVVVHRLGDEVAGAPDAGFRRGPPRTRRAASWLSTQIDTQARTGSSSSGTFTIVGNLRGIVVDVDLRARVAPAASKRGARSSSELRCGLLRERATVGPRSR